MHIVRSKFKAASGKVYETILLRESYREGKKVKKRTVANLTNCSQKELAAIELALKHSKKPSESIFQGKPTITEGLSVGGVWAVFQIAKRLGIVEALGNERHGQLALWQVIAKVLEQGSRLSAVRLAETYAIASVIELEKGFNEEDLYKNLFWLAENQADIEDKIFQKRLSAPPSLFLYDVTSSYLEGEQNELANWGYNRDGKKGKKQIVIGLMSAEDGTPVTAEVFKGNTQDTSTFASQVKKAKERFGCEKVTFVGDRGMIKSGQIETLQKWGFHHITAITKIQIESLLKNGIIHYELFDEKLVEVESNGLRYIIRRNPVRAKEIAHARVRKRTSIEDLVTRQNAYLFEHPKAQVETALKTVNAKIDRLKLREWLSVNVQERTLILSVDEDALVHEGKLDGCYVIKTDLIHNSISTEIIHARYKDLAMVESAFRTVKSDLELRPIHVRKETSTRGHVLVVMLAYMITRELDNAWKSLYLTVGEGLLSLSTLTLLEVSHGDGMTYQEFPKPREQNRSMLEAIEVELPKILPINKAHVVTRKNRRNLNVKN